MGVPCRKPSAPQGWPWGQRSRHGSSRDQQLALLRGPTANPHTSRQQRFQLLQRWFPKRQQTLPNAPGGPAPLLPPPRLDKMSSHCGILASSILTHGSPHPEESQSLLLLKAMGFKSSRIRFLCPRYLEATLLLCIPRVVTAQTTRPHTPRQCWRRRWWPAQPSSPMASPAA